jgi:hypothetical protein
MAAPVLRSLPLLAPAAATVGEASGRAASVLSTDMQSRIPDCVASQYARPATATLTGSEVAPTFQARSSPQCVDEGAEEEVAASARLPAQRPSREASGLHVHVEQQMDGLHVWVGAPMQPGLALALVKAALLHPRAEVLTAVARLVVNGKDEPIGHAPAIDAKEKP